MNRLHKSTILLLTFLIACSPKKQEHSQIPETIIPVKTIAVVKQELNPDIYVSGQFTTEDESVLSFKNGGIVRTIYVREGDAIKKGQLLATLDMTEIDAITGQAEIVLEKAVRDYNRATSLYRDSVATLEQMQNAQTAMEIAQKQVANARYNRKTGSIYANRSGYVLRKFAQEGQTVGPGTPILQINGASQGKWVLKSGVSDFQWASIGVGDKAIITTDALPGKEIPGTVTARSEGSDPMSGTFWISISLAGNQHHGIAAGLFGKARVTVNKKVEAWTLPYDALMDSEKDKGYVFVLTDSNIVKKIPVTIDRLDQGKVIISAGLEGYDRVIMEGNAYLVGGMKVKVIE